MCVYTQRTSFDQFAGMFIWYSTRNIYLRNTMHFLPFVLLVAAKVGEPVLEVVLEPGDLLYFPR